MVVVVGLVVVLAEIERLLAGGWFEPVEAGVVLAGSEVRLADYVKMECRTSDLAFVHQELELWTEFFWS